MAKGTDNATRRRPDHLDLERKRIETMLRRDGRRFLLQIIGLMATSIGLMAASMVVGAVIWEAIKP